MTITRDNYEHWFIDHFDGVLSPEQEQELRAFLVLNADLQEEFDSFEIITLEESSEQFSGKSNLKKKIKNSQEENYFIAYAEQILPPSEKLMVEEYVLENPKRKRELDLFLNTRLKPNPTIFREKHKLYKKETVTVPLYYRIAIAATILILLGVFGVINYSGTSTNGIRMVSKKNNAYPDLIVKEIIPEHTPEQKQTPILITQAVVFPTEKMDYVVLSSSSIPTSTTTTNAFFHPIDYTDEGSLVNRNPDAAVIDPTLGELLKSKLRNKVNTNLEEEPVKGKLRWWELVNALGKGLSTLTGRPFKMDKKLDENGKLMAYRIDYGDYTIEKEMKP